MLKNVLNLFRSQSNQFNDFEKFKKDISWFIKKTDKVVVSAGAINLTDDFINTFPRLSNLIKSARILEVGINEDHYKLFSWTSNQNKSCGWLCKQELPISSINLLPEHQILLDNIGGIKESYNQSDSFTNNQNFLFIKSECIKGLGYSELYYLDRCRNKKIAPMIYKNLLSFVNEANGAQTLYDPSTAQIYLFSHDHNFDYVTSVEGQPPYTFHLINNVNSFVEYAEEIANQWAVYVNL